MAEYKKYMFDNFVLSCNRKPKKAVLQEEPVFEDETAEAIFEESPTPEIEVEPEVVFHQEDMEKAIIGAEEKGYERGFNAAVTENEKAQVTLLENINTRLMTILADASMAQNNQEQETMQFALGVIKKLLPSLEAKVAKEEVEAFIQENFKNFSHEASLSFKFNPDMIAEIAPKISHIAEKNDFEGKIALHKDESLGLSDCVIEWKNGGVERSTAQTLSQIEDILH